MSNVVEVPKPDPPDNLAKANTATEYAFNALVSVAIHNGLIPSDHRPMGVMYLPNQAVTRLFQEACRSVIQCLGGTIE